MPVCFYECMIVVFVFVCLWHCVRMIVCLCLCMGVVM